MHVLNQIQNVYIKSCKPVKHQIILVHDFIVIKVFGCDRSIFRTDLHMISFLIQELFILTAIDGI